MEGKVIIGVDAANGDTIRGVSVPRRVVRAVKILGKRDYDLILTGDKEEILDAFGRKVPSGVDVVQAPKKTEYGKGRNYEISHLADLVEEGRVNGIFSIGETGQAFRTALKLGRLEGLGKGKFPALVAYIPNENNVFLFLDVGATVESEVINTYTHGIMAAAYANHFLEVIKPRLGILCNGTEDEKGREFDLELDGLLRHESAGGLAELIEYVGKVEMDDALNHDGVDILLTDGFTGNTNLKTMGACVRKTKRKLAKYLGPLAKLVIRVDPNKYNGAFALGLNGVFIKGHGNSDEYAVAAGINAAYKHTQKDVNPHIQKALDKFGIR